MKFYKVHGDFIKSENSCEEGEKKTQRRNSYPIQAKTMEFNAADGNKFCFASEVNEEFVTIGVIVGNGEKTLDFAQKFAKFIGVNAILSAPDEITFANMANLLCSASRQGYIEDDDEILEHFGLDRLNRRRGLEFGENLINSKGEKKQLLAEARKLFMNETLVPELERIYTAGKNSRAAGHPVHYIVETDDRDTRRTIYRTLLDALYANARIVNLRYSYLDFRPSDSYSQMAYETLYKVSEGGAVVVRYLANEDFEEGSDASGGRETILNLCDMAKRYRNKVLTVFCFPRECKKVKAEFYENLGTMSFIELREDFVNGSEARAFLSGLAKKNHVRVDKNLFFDVKEDRCYLAPELVAMFEEWYNVKLKTSIYPQYKEVSSVRRETVKTKPVGTAYDELFEMIGLTEAKDVIKKAINYYKMQKLYDEKGVKRNNPAMHMIFTGNPGTAKTTVARLFARIMKENGLLSKGQLVEVGRGNLVGKYTGWTAQTVQAKFMEARGGVLFIDEAYSLVDGHEGSFGDEAINTIVQEMENHRSEVVVIFAGYPDKMESFLCKNPGMRSRIAFHVPFADYSSEELCRIADMISRKNGMTLEAGAREKLEKAFEVARTNIDFGNGRYVRNLFEQAKMNQATRLLKKDFEEITSDDITTITAEDIVIPESSKTEMRRIGFC